MTNRRNIFSRFFRLLVMLHKISYAHFTEWNNKRKRKAFAAGIYFLSILPEFVLLAGTFLAARGQDGYVHLVNVPQKVVFYGLASLAERLPFVPVATFRISLLSRFRSSVLSTYDTCVMMRLVSSTFG